MSRTFHARATAAAAAAILALSLFAVAPAQAAPPSDEVVTVATDLNNPRQLDIGPGQRVYVAEAGDGTACDPIPGVGAEFEFCGLTGSVTEIDGDEQRRVVTDLPSLAFNGEIMGTSDVEVWGNSIAVLVGGMAGATSARDGLPAEFQAFGTLRTGSLRGAPLMGADMTSAADISAIEVMHNPDGNQPPDSNAVGLASLGGGSWAVTDAGGNTLWTVGSDGESPVAVFPNGAAVQNPFAPPGVMVPPQAVPTDVVVGPDGAFYVSQLTGFPFPTGGSTIWRVTADGDVSAYATGLTMVTSLAWRGGTLYAVQLDDSNFFNGHVGSVREITPGGSMHEAVVDELSAPYGIAIHGHSAYVSVDSISSGGGSVVQIDLR